MLAIDLRGMPFFVHDYEDALSKAIIRNGDYWESDILDYLYDTYPHQKTILDVGANIGNHSHYFARYLNYNLIVSFEPIEENINILKENLAPFKSTVIIPSAVSDHNGTTHMAISSANSGAHEVNPDGSVEVKIRTIDSLALSHVTLIKIDAEYHEPQVIVGAEATIKKNKPLILIEDSNREYGPMLKLLGYEMLKEWTHHNTFLYGV